MSALFLVALAAKIQLLPIMQSHIVKPGLQ
jgi:hypothetical protein